MMNNLILVLMFQAVDLVSSANNTTFEKNINENLCATDGLKMTHSGMEMPKNILKANFAVKYNPPSVHFRPSKLDELWFNKFTPAEVADKNFWTLVLNACHVGVELMSCDGYVEYACHLIFNYDRQNEDIKLALRYHLDSITKYLIKFKKYDILIRMMKEKIDYVSERTINCIHLGFKLFDDILNSITDENYKIQFIQSLDDVFVANRTLIYMSHQPELLNEISSSLVSNFLNSWCTPHLLNILWSYRNYMDHDLIYRFKSDLIAQLPPHDKGPSYYPAIIDYLHKNTPLRNFTSLSMPDKLLFAAYKNDWEGFLEILDSNDFGSDRPSRFLCVKVLNNPEIIREILKRESKVFKDAFRYQFELLSLDKIETVNLVEAYMEHYADNPGIHDGIIVYPTDLESGLTNCVKRELVQGQNSNVTPKIIINTIILTMQNNPDVLEKTLVSLIDTEILNEPMDILWRKLNFESFSRILGNKKITEIFPPKFDILNWELKDYVKMFRHRKVFDLYYPHREEIPKTLRLKARSFSHVIIYHLLTLKELKLFLKFIEPRLLDFEFPNGTLYPIKMWFSEYELICKKLVSEYCGNDFEKSMIYLNPNRLQHLLEKSCDNVEECEEVLENWVSTPKKSKFLTRFLSMSSNFPTLFVRISSLKMPVESLRHLLLERDNIIFRFDFYSIVSELEFMSESELQEIVNNINQVPDLMPNLLNWEGMSTKRLEPFLKSRNII